MRASTTDDNAAAGKIIGGFVSVIYFFGVLVPSKNAKRDWVTVLATDRTESDKNMRL